MLVFQDFSLFVHDMTRLLQHIESIYYLLFRFDLFLLFSFLCNQESLYMIFYDLDLFDEEIFTTMEELPTLTLQLS